MPFVVYELCYPEGQPFYIGKGQPDRPERHLYEARQGNKSHRANVIRRLWSKGLEPVIEIALQTDDEREAFAEEVRLIAHYRDAGIALTNQTNGGEGFTGGRHTPEVRALIAEAARNQSLESRRQMTEKMRTRVFTVEHRRRISESQRCRWARQRAQKETRDARVSMAA